MAPHSGNSFRPSEVCDTGRHDHPVAIASESKSSTKSYLLLSKARGVTFGNRQLRSESLAIDSDASLGAAMSHRGDRAAASVEFRRVTKRYGPVVAVNAVSFTIEPGTLVTLLGPSGCGKTTTLRLIAGLEIASDGQVLIGGRDVTRLSAADRNVSMVFQSYALFPHMTVLENVAYGPTVAGARKAQAILARRFGARVSLMLVPTYVSHTNYLDESDTRGTGAVGVGGEWRLNSKMAITGEWIGQASGVKNDFQSGSIGFSIATARHVFHLFATNTSALSVVEQASVLAETASYLREMSGDHTDKSCEIWQKFGNWMLRGYDQLLDEEGLARLRHLDRRLQQLRPDSRQPGDPDRCLRSRLPSTSRTVDLRIDAAPGEDRQRERHR